MTKHDSGAIQTIVIENRGKKYKIQFQTLIQFHAVFGMNRIKSCSHSKGDGHIRTQRGYGARCGSIKKLSNSRSTHNL